MPTMRGQPRLVYQPHHYQRLIDLKPSPPNTLEFCIGSLAEMTEGDVYEAIERYSRQGGWRTCISATSAARCRTTGRRSSTTATSTCCASCEILERNGFDGVLIPDHTPQMSSAPWHAGMAYALGYIRAGLDAIERGFVPQAKS